MQTTVIDLSPPIAPLLATCKQVLTDHYGDRPRALILFGSAARQTVTPESDLDVLVILQPCSVATCGAVAAASTSPT